MQENTGLKKRLAEFLKYIDISQAKFAENTGLSKGFANNVGDSIRVEKLKMITNVYPELNTAWLLTGEGEMLKKSLESPENMPTVSAPGDSVAISKDVFEIIKKQANSLERKDAQVAELIGMLKEQMNQNKKAIAPPDDSADFADAK